MHRVKFSGIKFRTLVARFRWLWTAISLVWIVMAPLFLLQTHQISSELLVRPAQGQPVVDQFAVLTIIFGFFFVLSIALTLFAWHGWLLGKSRLGKANVN